MKGTMIAVPKLETEGILFPAIVQPPGSSKKLFLGGAGERGMEIGGKFITFTTIGVYLEEAAVSSLAGKWKGVQADELAISADFFSDIFTGPFEKLTRITMVLPLTGEQYSQKVTENCVAYWKAIGAYTEDEEEAVEKFKVIFKTETFPHGASIFFTHSPSGSLSIGFSKDGSVPEAEIGVIESRALSEAILESIIGEHGVSPSAKLSLASRFSELLKEPLGAKENILPEKAITVSL